MGIFDIFITIVFFTIGLLLIIFARNIGNSFYINIPTPINIFVLVERLFNKCKSTDTQNEFVTPGLSIFIWWLRIGGVLFVGICVFSVIHSLMNK